VSIRPCWPRTAAAQNRAFWARYRAPSGQFVSVRIRRGNYQIVDPRLMTMRHGMYGQARDMAARSLRRRLQPGEARAVTAVSAAFGGPLRSPVGAENLYAGSAQPGPKSPTGC
jgi:hypothetical protein